MTLSTFRPLPPHPQLFEVGGGGLRLFFTFTSFQNSLVFFSSRLLAIRSATIESSFLSMYRTAYLNLALLVFMSSQILPCLGQPWTRQCVTCRGLHILASRRKALYKKNPCVSSKMGCVEYIWLRTKKRQCRSNNTTHMLVSRLCPDMPTV